MRSGLPLQCIIRGNPAESSAVARRACRRRIRVWFAPARREGEEGRPESRLTSLTAWAAPSARGETESGPELLIIRSSDEPVWTQTPLYKTQDAVAVDHLASLLSLPIALFIMVVGSRKLTCWRPKQNGDGCG
jgi:hypothetical protein